MHFDLDITIFITYIIINVGFGLYWGRNVKTIKDYALGGRNFSTGTLVATIMAAWLGGDYLFITLAQVYTTGIHYLIGCTGMAFGLFLIAYFFVPRMGEFLGNISVASAMGNLYGPQVRIIAAITGGIVAAGFIALQFKVFADLFKHYVGISDQYTIFLAGGIVVLYSAFGGIRSVAFTDVIQFFTFGVLIPVLSVILWNEYVGANGVNFDKALSNPIFDWKEYVGLTNGKFWQLVLLFVLFALPGFDPSLFQRISIGRNISQVQKAFTISSLLLLFILLGMSWIGFLLFNVDQSLQPENLVHYIINNYAHTGLKGFVLIGIVAMCMSNADANLNSASVILTHDFCAPLGIKLKNELFLSKTIAIIMGCTAISLASLNYDLLSLVFMTQSFHIPVTAVPLIMAIFGFRSTTKSVLIGMGAGFVTVVIWRTFFMDSTGVDSIVPGSLGNLLLFMGSHYFLRQPGGWVGVKDKVALAQIQIARERKWSNIVNIAKMFNFIEFCKSNAPKNELTYSGFGLFSLISTICTMYSTPNMVIADKNLLLFFYETMLILSVSFITYPIWPSALKKETPVQVIWNFSVFYILIVCSTFFVMLNNFSQIQLMISLVNLIVVATLLRWQASLILIFVGVFVTIEFYEYCIGTSLPDSTMLSIEVKIIYFLLLLSSILIIFFKPRQEEHELIEAKNDHLGERVQDNEEELQRLVSLKNEFLRNLNHEMQTPVTGITSTGQALYDNYDKLTEEQRIEGLKVIAQSSRRFESYTNSILDLSKLTSLNPELKKTTFDISELLFNRLESCIKIYLDGKHLEFETNIEPHIMFNCDKHYMQLVFDNLIINAISYSNEGKISIKLSKNDNGIEFEIKDEGIGIDKKDLFDIFEAFTVSSKTRSTAHGRGVGLAICKKSIEIHGGKIWAESNGSKGAVFKFEIGWQHHKA